MHAEELFGLKGRELQAELIKLRGARVFTTHIGIATIGVKKGSRRKKKDEDLEGEAKRKKMVFIVFACITVLWVYDRFLS